MDKEGSGVKKFSCRQVKNDEQRFFKMADVRCMFIVARSLMLLIESVTSNKRDFCQT